MWFASLHYGSILRTTFFISCLSFVFCDISTAMAPIVQLDGLGSLQGIDLISRDNLSYFAYLGIPYGRVPRRFDVSVPEGPWEGSFVANKTPEACAQHSRFLDEGWGNEDCLALNVFTKNISERLPVIVLIHPGGFQNGGTSPNQAEFFIDENVVVVSINYRLGAFGFLDTTDGTVQGNMGLKDQVLALKWIQKHISSFGGDPNLVTLVGCSAGSASINFHLLSPLSNGLFHRGIMISGSSLNPWALQTQPKILFEQLLELSNCTRETTLESVEALRNLSKEDLLLAQAKMPKYPVEFDLENMHFVPTVESENSTGPKFIEEHPLVSMQNGTLASKVPILASTVITEGLFFSALLWSKPDSLVRLDQDWNEIAPNMLYFEQFPENISEISESIRKFYLKDENITTDNIEGLSFAFGDRLISSGVGDAAVLLSKHMPLYPFLFNYTGEKSQVEVELGVTGLPGVSHADELLYLNSGTIKSDQDVDFSRKYIKLLMSFAKDGEPSFVWGMEGSLKPLNATSVESPCEFYEISMDKIAPVPDPFLNRRLFWQQVLPIFK